MTKLATGHPTANLFFFFLTDQNLVGVHLAKERLGITSFKFGSFIFMAASNSPVKNLPHYRSRYGCT